MNFSFKISVIVLLVFSLNSCKEESYYPKPYGFVRIGFPKDKNYKVYNKDCPFTFEYPYYSVVVDKDYCHQDIKFPKYKATLHISNILLGKTKQNNLFYHSEYSRKLAYEHRVKADYINQTTFSNDSAKVYGVVYEIEGNVACNYQFYLTDSVKHFYRGALYFNASPNIDSIRPVLEFLKEDFTHLIETFDWK